MQSIEFLPSSLRGALQLPPSKSYCHRGVIAAALAQGESIIERVSYSDDILATIAGVQAMGAVVAQEGDCLRITGGLSPKSSFTVDCKESGSTLRFLMPLALTTRQRALFLGQGKLGQRPLGPYLEIFKEQGIYHSAATVPMELYGQLRAGHYQIKGDVSSQFITGLLYTLPLLKGDSTIQITDALESKDYIALTLQILKLFGIDIVQQDERHYFIRGNQVYKPAHYQVEGDFSQAAFWLAAGALQENIVCHGLSPDSSQGDKAILDFISAAGGQIHRDTDSIQVAAAMPLKAFTADVSQCPDIAPILAVLASVAEGTSRIIGAGRLRYKECDRLKAIAHELNKLGAKVTEEETSLTIIGRPQLEGGEVHSWGDHRIAMALAIASLKCKNPVLLHNSGVVSKSYPNFYEDFKMLGGNIHERNLG